ncbi:Flp family type IVb pilin [Onishia taeanensis]
MNKLMMGVKRFWQEEEGTEVVEWALVGGLIVAAGAAIFTNIGTAARTNLTEVFNAL